MWPGQTFITIKNTQAKTMQREKENMTDLIEQILLWDYHPCLAQSFAPLGMRKVQGLPLEED